MRKIAALIPGVELAAKATLISGRRKRQVTLAELRPARIEQWDGTSSWRGEAADLTVQIWQNRNGHEHVETHVTASTAGRWSLAGWVFELRITVAADDRVAWPLAAGALVPVARLWNEAKTLELTYPVYASMQWLDVFGAQGGVYLAVHDGEPYFKHIQMRAERRGRRAMLIVRFDYPDLAWPAGRQWNAPPLVVAKHAGDWRDGARIYRAWADSWFHHAPVPEFMLRACGHNMVSFPRGRQRVPFKEIPRLVAETRRLGIPGIHLADWMEEGFDTFYPAYKPDPTLGGHRVLRNAIECAAKREIWTCLYTNGRLLDPAGPHGRHAFPWAVKLPAAVRRRFQEMWQRSSAPDSKGWNPRTVMIDKPARFNRDGTAAQEFWGRILVPMCPTVEGWRELWLSRIVELARTLKPRMFQVDQVCGCWGLPCYDPKHPHSSPSLAWSGYTHFCAEMRQRVHEVNPEIAFWSEGVNDILGRSFDGLQLCLRFDTLLAGIGEWDPRIFKLAFPEYLLVTDCTDLDNKWLILWSLIVGGHFHLSMPEPSTLSADARRWIRFAAGVRSRYWREYASHDIALPEVSGDDHFKCLAYRHGGRVLLVGASVDPSDDPLRQYSVRIRLPWPVRKLIRSDCFCGRRASRITLGRRHCTVNASGPLLMLWELNRSDQ